MFLLLDRSLTGVAYGFSARAVNYLGHGVQWSDTFWLDEGTAFTPNTPTDFQVVSASTTSTSFEISWSMPDDNRTVGVFQYELSIEASSASSPSFYSIPISNDNCTAGCTAVIADGSLVSPAVTYNLKLASVNTFGRSPQTPSALQPAVTVTTLSDAPGAVSDLSVSGATRDSFTVTWTASPANGATIDSYQVTIRECDSGTTAPASCTPGSFYRTDDWTGFDPSATTLATSVTSLPAGRNFTLGVAAVNSQGSSPVVTATDPAFYTTLSVPNQVDRPFAGTPIPGLSLTSSITISFVAPFDNGNAITNYTLTIDAGCVPSCEGTGGVEEHVALTMLMNDGVYTYTKLGLWPGTTHTFQVAATNALGTGPISDSFSSTTDASVPATPPAPTINVVTSGLIDIAVQPSVYNGGVAISHYEIENSGVTNGTIIALPVCAPTCLTNASQYLVNPREANREYNFRARAVNINAPGAANQRTCTPTTCSEWSSYLLIPSISSGYPNTPQDLTETEVEARAITISWSMPSDTLSEGISNYVLYISEFISTFSVTALQRDSWSSTSTIYLDGGNCDGGCAFTVNATNFPSIRPAMQYTMVLAARNQLGQGSDSNVLVANTSNSVPDPVTSVTVSDVVQTGMTVAWTAPAYNNGMPITEYTIRYVDAADSSNDGVVTSSSTDRVLTGLASGRNFSIAVSAANAIGSSTAESAVGVYTTLAVPMQGNEPFLFGQDLSGLDKMTTIFIAWIPPFGNGLPIDAFLLYIDGSDDPANTTTRSTFLHSGLYPGTAHNYAVSATNALGEGARSPVFATVTENGPPAQISPPSVFIISENGTQVVQLTLEAAAYAGVYQGAIVEYELQVNQIDTQDTDLNSTTITYNVSVESLVKVLPRANTQDSRYRARAVSNLAYDPAKCAQPTFLTSYCAGAWSTETLVPADFRNQPTAPTQMAESDVTAYDFLLTWQMRDSEVNVGSTFEIRLTEVTSRRLAEAPQTLAALAARRLSEDPNTVYAPWSSCTGPVNDFYSCSHTVPAPSPDATFNTQMRANKGIYASPFAPDATTPLHVTTLTAPPDEPLNVLSLEQSPPTNDTLTISWDKPSDNGEPINGYLISVSDGSSVMLNPDGSVGTGSSCPTAACTGGACTEAATLQTTLSSLTAGTDFKVEVIACNVLGASTASCICTGGACTTGCNSNAGVVHTGDVPQQPVAPFSSDDNELEALKKRNLFLNWAQPFSHYLPVTYSTLRISNTTRSGVLDPYTTFTVSGNSTELAVGCGLLGVTASTPPLCLQPATQFPVYLQTCNALGCSDPSERTWISTTPDVPEPPPTPYCNQEGQSSDTLHFYISQPEANGMAISEYQVDIYNTADTSGAPSLQRTYQPPLPDNGFYLTDANVFVPNVEYTLIARAVNGLGSSPDSAPSGADSGCLTRPLPPSSPPPEPPQSPPQQPPEPPFDYMLVVIPLVIVLVLVIIAVVLYKYTELPKILQPRLRKKEEKLDPLEDFIIRENTPMEDLDPELKLNPVIIAKMEFEKEQARKKGGKGGKKAAGGYGPGALKRLGINITPQSTPVEKKQMGLKGIDVMIHQQNQGDVAAKGAAAGTGSGREATTRPSKRGGEDVDMGRTLTIMSQKKRDNNKKLIADRMIKEAQTAKCAATSVSLARAANAKLRHSDDEHSGGALGPVAEE